MAEASSRPSVGGTISAFWELTKPRVTTMVVLTTAAGFYLASDGPIQWLLLFHALMGTGLLAAGTAVLNQVMERDNDGRMRRTACRPLPSGRLRSAPAGAFGLLLSVAGTIQLAVLTEPLAALLGFLTCVVYLLAYTPLKTRTPFCTTVGAFPGAVPPLIGWAAVRGSLNLEALVLFSILFLWQFPHFLSIAWIYRDDYERGGFKMLPIVDGDGRRTGRRVVLFSVLLLAASIVPTWMGGAGWLYLVGAIALGGLFLREGYGLAVVRSSVAARRLLRMSVIYLPLLLILLSIDQI